MNEHDMISNISYIMHCHPEMTNKILIKHGANPDNELWTTGCDIASAYKEILNVLESSYDRNDLETQLDYHIQEILGWHDINEGLENSDMAWKEGTYNIYLAGRFVRKVETADAVTAYLQNLSNKEIKDIRITKDNQHHTLNGFLQKSDNVTKMFTNKENKRRGLTESTPNSDPEIPAPFDKYYEVGMLNDGSIPEDEIPDAFDYYDMKLLAIAYAKEQYEDALADNCLDYCYLIEDADGLALVTTAGLRVYNIDIAEVKRCIGITEDFDVREPSSVDYGSYITSYHRELAAKIEKYDIAKIEENRRYVEYYGKVNGHEFLYTEGKADSGTYAKELYIDSKEVDVYHSGTFHMGINGVGEFGLMTLIKLLENNDFSNIVFKSDELDDYEESLVEDTEMSDAQRLALQELDSCLDYGELDAEKHALAYQIQWDINFEDILLFINGIDIPLQDIKHVEYGDCSNEYDGCYDVTLHDGTTKKYGWHDFDATASLTCIDCKESLTESADGWEKPFSWTERYVKDGFAVYDNYQGGWHVEQTRPKTKHFGNFKTLDAAKAAADAEINKRNRKNADKPVQFGVHSFTTDSIIFRGTEDECAEYINNNGLENEAEIYRMDANDRHYLEESASNQFSVGDRVYVTVSNRQGTVTKLVSDDVVEVEFEANGTYPARIDRFYTSEVDLVDLRADTDLPEIEEDVSEQYWAVFAKDTATGKEYCAGVYGSERDAYYWAGMDRSSDTEYHYGNFKYRVERVSDYTDDLDKSRRELDTLKLFNHSTHKENDLDDDF